MTRPIRVSLLRVDLGAGIKHFLGFTDSDEPDKALGSSKAGGYSQTDLGLCKLRVLRRETDVTAHREFTAAAERKAVDRGDDRDRERLDAAEDLVAALAEASPSDLERPLISPMSGAGRQSSSARPGDNQRTDLVKIVPSSIVFRSSRTWEFRAFRAFSRSMVADSVLLLLLISDKAHGTIPF